MYLSRGQMLAGIGRKFYKDKLLTEKHKLDNFKACGLGDHAQVARAAPVEVVATPVAAIHAGTETNGAAGSSNGNKNRKR